LSFITLNNAIMREERQCAQLKQGTQSLLHIMSPDEPDNV